MYCTHTQSNIVCEQYKGADMWIGKSIMKHEVETKVKRREEQFGTKNTL